MTKRMLIDATYPEETRVVVLDGDRIDDFDYESASRRTLKGNIYLGKITRVEPSLQAAFVEYGGNRHGFLPFNDIHPDYYRIPVSDREALIAEEVEADARLEPDGNGHEAGPNGAAADEHDDAGNGNGADESSEPIETVGGDEAEEAPRIVRHRVRRNYKIQEVIKRRQIILVQVTKEERGNKGAALTSYISLAGRYCVLMPNAIRGGGISRKITDAKDRKRLKEVIDSLHLPRGMGVILRTAGMQRTKAEIKRDYEFLLRVWEEIRENTLESRAPALIYEEANLIKRTIRDVYTRDIQEVIVEGEDAYRSAKEFMRALMPSHAKRVQLYKDRAVHLFPRHGVESQLDALHSHTVRLRSGGYVVINATEALVAIDVNSGRATRERHIEETALKTNLEAADEIARQLRLRDLAGIIVIDFIDMEERRNNGAVERRFKEALKHDRARIQMGRISQLGLLELSRQRLRPSLFETSMTLCPTCQGHGSIRSVESTALYVFRALEEDAAGRRDAEIAVHVPTPVALYVLNHKRDALVSLEQRQGMRIFIERDDGIGAPGYRIEHIKSLPRSEEAAVEAVIAEPEPPALELEAEEEEEDRQPVPTQAEAAEDADESERDRQKRRRRGRRGGRRRARRPEDQRGAEAEAPAAEPAAAEPAAQPEPVGPELPELQPEPIEAVEAVPETVFVPDAEEPKPRRRPRRRRRTEPAPEEGAVAAAPVEAETPTWPDAEAQPAPELAAEPATDEPGEAWPAMPAPEPEAAEAALPDAALHTPPAPRERVPQPAGNGAEAEPAPEPAGSAAEPRPERPRRRGWWQRLVE